ncbi:hypothetical protein ALNOE001_18310 [Candidatus Methanobinarius endosymbioticus]|uniref:Class III signal peptide-containing protein n=1 Tax=Candidatus Methanobinarius endosymbioticus TaxID=2006182 RepID=A0A366M8R1_9EURY|nr:hypothetical protein ALNOE001_18310 [Candidatus Methanobinarius endosymbioticus]
MKIFNILKIKELLSKKLLNKSFLSKFKGNNQGQFSLEFLLISFISILILISFSLHLSEIGIDSTMPTTELIAIKSEMIKIINCIDDVYADGIDSKRTINVEVPIDTNIIFYNDSIRKKEIAIGNIDIGNQIKSIELEFNALNIHNNWNIRKNTNTRIVIE